MKIRVFCGPTLPPSEARALLPQAEVAGPVALGDVVHAVEDGVQAVAIVDGFFDQRQPVWHKEILWAIHRGVSVYGAASMGALRAAELAPFGMHGVGRIFELFRDGWLERDDEVAIVHDPADSAYRPRTDALVNMRFTFRLAARREIVSLAFAQACTEAAEQLFYAERTYQRVLQTVEKDAAMAGPVATLRDWLNADAAHRVDQKREDARELLRLLANEARTPTSVPSFEFAHTHAWAEFMRSRAPR